MNGENDIIQKVALGDEETVEPTPSPEQIALWDTLDEIFDVRALDREEDFMRLKEDERRRLASVGLTEDIGRVAKNFSLNPEQTSGLVRIVRYLAIGVIPPTDIEKIAGGFKLTGDAITRMARELRAMSGFPEPSLREEITAEREQPPSRPFDRPAPVPPPGIAMAPLEAESPEKTSEIPPIANDTKPFILHEEKPLFTKTAPPNAPSVSFEPTSLRMPKPKSRPAIARIETPEGEGARVVHYSDLRTPLDKNSN